MKENSGSIISKIPVKLTVELGNKILNVEEISKLSLGSVVELDEFVGTPLNIMVNEIVIGKGEVVVVNDKYGVKIISLEKLN